MVSELPPIFWSCSLLVVLLNVSNVAHIVSRPMTHSMPMLQNLIVCFWVPSTMTRCPPAHHILLWSQVPVLRAHVPQLPASQNFSASFQKQTHRRCFWCHPAVSHLTDNASSASATSFSEEWRNWSLVVQKSAVSGSHGFCIEGSPLG